MSNRVKIQIDFVPEFEMIMINGQDVKVYKRIPYIDKIACAEEYAAMCCVIDTKQEIAYEAFDDIALKFYLMLKWYTNIDVSEYEFDMGVLHDKLAEYKKTIEIICGNDYEITEDIMDRYVTSTINIYTEQHSFAQKAKMSLASILNGEDIVKTLAESKLMNEEMIDIISKAQKHDEQNVVAFPWAAKKGE